jgi:hypothetical protein
VESFNLACKLLLQHTEHGTKVKFQLELELMQPKETLIMQNVFLFLEKIQHYEDH